MVTALVDTRRNGLLHYYDKLFLAYFDDFMQIWYLQCFSNEEFAILH